MDVTAQYSWPYDIISVYHVCKLAPQWPCPVQNWLSVEHNYQERSKPIGWRKHGISNGDSMTESVHGYSWHWCYTYRWASTQWQAAWWSSSVGKSALVKTGLDWWNHHRSPLGCGQTSIISRLMILTSHQMKIQACLRSASHWNMW